MTTSGIRSFPREVWKESFKREDLSTVDETSEMALAVRRMRRTALDQFRVVGGVHAVLMFRWKEGECPGVICSIYYGGGIRCL